MLAATKEQFEEKARLVHGYVYDYTKVDYKNNHTKVCIICHQKDENGVEHGEFWQTPMIHTVSQCGCPKCFGSRKKTTDEFIQEARRVHGDKYDYSEVDYRGNKKKVKIICREHGAFFQTPNSHLAGQGCRECQNKQGGLNRRKTTDEFIQEAQRLHGDKYDYSQVEYVTANTPIRIICREHGVFFQTPKKHLDGHGCQQCFQSFRKGKEEFVCQAKETHGNIYDYENVEYKNNRTKVCIICREHGEFWQTPEHHLNGRGCPKCKESLLEKKVRGILEKEQIKYIYEAGFNDGLTWLGRQTVDFFIPDYNICIECQGVQHFHAVEAFGGEEAFRKQLERDLQKYDKCLAENMMMFYIVDDYLDIDYSDKSFNNIYEDSNVIKINDFNIKELINNL